MRKCITHPQSLIEAVRQWDQGLRDNLQRGCRINWHRHQPSFHPDPEATDPTPILEQWRGSSVHVILIVRAFMGCPIQGSLGLVHLEPSTR